MLHRAATFLLLGVAACGSDGPSAPGVLLDGGKDAAADQLDGPDAGQHGDASLEDAGARDDGGVGGDCAPFVMPDDCVIAGVLPQELRCTGLYGDWEARALACGVREYTPAYELWSDGAVKRRFVQLPPGATIDVSDPDGFVYPVGTQFWKEFRVEQGGALRRAETRLLRKVDAGWLFTTYVWDAGEQKALQVNEGVVDWNASGHTIPTREQCAECHEGRKDRVLGWDFLMLGAGATGVTRELLEAEGALAPAAAAGLGSSVPGDDVERAALGYLHANCGVSCHNESQAAQARDTGFFMRLEAGTLGSVFTTRAAITGINQRPSWRADLGDLPAPEGGFFRLEPLDTAGSLVLARMGTRGSKAQMPPLGTNAIDEHGIALITAWVEHMTEARGYPAPDATSGASVFAP